MLNLFHGANLTLSSDVDQDTQMFGLHERSLTYQRIISYSPTAKIRNAKIWNIILLLAFFRT